MRDPRDSVDAPHFQDCVKEASEIDTPFSNIGSTTEYSSFCGALIPSFSSKSSSSLGDRELSVPSASKPATVADVADSQWAK